MRVNEPYRNPAEHRKIRAKWMHTRRWAGSALCVAVLSVLTLTVLEGKALGEKIRFEQGISYMPIKMALKSGISGSPVLDSEGRVAGIASAVSTQDENLSFMVSSDTAKDFLKDYLFIDD